jgi:hypothetical protein
MTMTKSLNLQDSRLSIYLQPRISPFSGLSAALRIAVQDGVPTTAEPQLLTCARQKGNEAFWARSETESVSTIGHSIMGLSRRILYMRLVIYHHSM